MHYWYEILIYYAFIAYNGVVETYRNMGEKRML